MYAARAILIDLAQQIAEKKELCVFLSVFILGAAVSPFTHRINKELTVRSTIVCEFASLLLQLFVRLLLANRELYAVSIAFQILALSAPIPPPVNCASARRREIRECFRTRTKSIPLAL